MGICAMVRPIEYTMDYSMVLYCSHRHMVYPMVPPIGKMHNMIWSMALPMYYSTSNGPIRHATARAMGFPMGYST